MIVDKTLIFKHRDGHSLDPFLAYPAAQHPVVLQLGGNAPAELAEAVRLAGPYAYDEINLNCGCPSPRVSGKGCFGAALMKDPPSVRALVGAMREASMVTTGAPVTVKCRLGVDDQDSYPELAAFVRETSAQADVHHFVLHARKAFLEGLSPAQNRSVPPLKRDWVYRLLDDFHDLTFSINGGVQTLAEARDLLSRDSRLEGVMIGRAAYKAPWQTLSDADRCIFGEASNPATSRRQVLADYAALCDAELEARGLSGAQPHTPSSSSSSSHGVVHGDHTHARKGIVRRMIKPLLTLFQAEPGVKAWRRNLDQHLLRTDAPTVAEIVARAAEGVPSAQLDAPPPQTPPSSIFSLQQEGEGEGNVRAEGGERGEGGAKAGQVEGERESGMPRPLGAGPVAAARAPILG